MKKLVIICEGRTEANLVKTLFTEAFSNRFIVFPVTLPTGQNPCGGDSKGGWRRTKGYAHAINEMKDIISIHKNDIVTTFFDLYAFPKDIPCFESTQNMRNPLEKAETYEGQIKSDIMKSGMDTIFLPYVQPYEFEAFLFVEPEIAALEIAETEENMNLIITEMQLILNEYPTPEHINGGSHTAPSKRMQSIVPNYKKNKAGRAGFSWKIAKEIGIEKIREKCFHFNEWVGRIESL